MKANKFVNEQDDEAVSPVIAVILMVAITVVLAATVYVWVSGFGTSGSIKKFPQVTLADDTSDNALAAATIDTLAKLEHRGGDTISWGDYTINLFEAGTANTGLRIDDAQACTSPTNPFTGTFSVGNKVYVCDTAAEDFTSGAELKVQVIDRNQNSIVYENTVVAQ